MTDVVTIALAKGRLAEQALSLLEGMGIDCTEPRHPGRQLVLCPSSKKRRTKA